MHVRQTSTFHSIAGVYFQYKYSMAFVLCRLIQNKWRAERNSLGPSDLCSAQCVPCADLKDMLKSHFYIECYTGTLVILSTMSAWVSHNVLFSISCLYTHLYMCLLLNHLFYVCLTFFISTFSPSQLSESTTTLSWLPIILLLCIPMTLPTLTFLPL